MQPNISSSGSKLVFQSAAPPRSWPFLKVGQFWQTNLSGWRRSRKTKANSAVSFVAAVRSVVYFSRTKGSLGIVGPATIFATQLKNTRRDSRKDAHAARTALSCMIEISRPHCEPAHIAPLRPKLFIRDTLHEFAQLIKQRGLDHVDTLPGGPLDILPAAF